jgi:hypothetical protein
VIVDVGVNRLDPPDLGVQLKRRLGVHARRQSKAFGQGCIGEQASDGSGPPSGRSRVRENPVPPRTMIPPP